MSGSDLDEIGGLARYVGGGADALAADLAEAWLVLSMAEEGHGRDVRPFPEQLPSYLGDDWAKDVWRRLKGYAERHARPSSWPWSRREFDDLPWLPAS